MSFLRSMAAFILTVGSAIAITVFLILAVAGIFGAIGVNDPADMKLWVVTAVSPCGERVRLGVEDSEHSPTIHYYRNCVQVGSLKAPIGWFVEVEEAAQ